MRKYNVAILGATGAVGAEFIRLLEEREFPVNTLRLLASPRSAGRRIAFRGEELVVEAVNENSFRGIDIAFFCAGAGTSREWAPKAVESGAVVIDNSSAFRLDEGVPLVVPEVNREAIGEHRGIIANPNCSTIIMVVALAPLHRAAGIRRIVVSTYQAVSGAGAAAIAELDEQVRAYARGEEAPAQVLPVASLDTHYPIAFNLIPQIDRFDELGYTKEEWKMVYETRKILGEPELRISADHRAGAGVPLAIRSRSISRPKRASRPKRPGRSCGRRRAWSWWTIPRRCSIPCRCTPPARTPSTSGGSGRTRRFPTASTSGWWATRSAKERR